MRTMIAAGLLALAPLGASSLQQTPAAPPSAKAPSAKPAPAQPTSVQPAPAQPAPAPAQAPASAQTGPSEQLPRTGADAGWIAFAGAALLAAGIGLRRRAHLQR